MALLFLFSGVNGLRSNDYGAAASTMALSSGLYRFTTNFSAELPTVWGQSVSDDTKAHFHMVICNFLFLATGICASAQVGTLRSRRNALYLLSSVLIPLLLLNAQFYFAWLALWGVLHSCAHHLWPFITVKGLNIKASAFPDVTVHLAMHAIVHAAVLPHLSTPAQWTSTVILLGSIWNWYLSSYSRVDAKWFVNTSIFQAFSTGSWVGYLIAVGLHHQDGPVFETTMWLMWLGAGANWFLFKNSNEMLKKLFRISYLDTLFIIPVWLFMFNNWKTASLL